MFLSLQFSEKINGSDLKFNFISYGRIWKPYKDEIKINPISLLDSYPEIVSVALAQTVK